MFFRLQLRRYGIAFIVLFLLIFLTVSLVQPVKIQQLADKVRRKDDTSDQTVSTWSHDNEEDLLEVTSQGSEGIESMSTLNIEVNIDRPKSEYSIKNRLQTNHRTIYSQSTKDRKFMPVFLDKYPGYNANLIPHPRESAYWILVVQHRQITQFPTPSEQLVCTAAIQDDAVVCTEVPLVVPITPSSAQNCHGELEILNLDTGPHDARLFYGPEVPYFVYGAQSQFTCFGQWIHDARMLLDQFRRQRYMKKQPFTSAVELQRPSGWQRLEKNYFLFWDTAGQQYVHYELWPERFFSKINADGSASEDLAVASAYEDKICLAKYMPEYPHSIEGFHQATNSLSLTLCRRSDPFCTVDDSNTFIMAIVQHKSYYDGHGIYEPYVILFKRSAPFAIHAIAQKPLWIHGRQNLTEETDAIRYQGHPGAIPSGHTEMFFLTSISWKSHAQKYHGYIDDILFIGFGIEDTRPGIIDVLAGDLLQDLAFCG